MYRIWNINLPDSSLQREISRSLSISPFLAQLLINRDIKTVEDAEVFLKSDLNSLSSPFKLLDMKIACERIRKAVRNKEEVMIFGDYDVDGITGVALLQSVLKKLGLGVICYLPHRIKEGYGLNRSVIKIAKQHNIHLIVTVDCGISNMKEIEELKREAIDVIVTDHHLPIDNKIPAALAVINPKRGNPSDSSYELAGVGVVYKLACAIMQQELQEYLDFVCLGTLADNLPLTGDNRIIVKKGLEILSKTERPGLLSLMEVARINKDYLDSFDVSYLLAPRINASGRIDSAELSLNLLLSDSKEAARELAFNLNKLNSQRQQIEEKILKEAEEIIEQEINFKETKVIVLAKDGWHEGVLGIIASRIKDMFYRPTVVISIGDDLCRGSARSIKNFHIMEAFSECRDIIKNFGGHNLAGGFSILKDNIYILKERLNRLADKKLDFNDIHPTLDIDMELRLGELKIEFLEEIDKLKPFGEGNPSPLFYTRGLKLRREPEVLGNDTLRLWVSDGKFTYPAVGFHMSDLKKYLSTIEYFDLVYSLKPTRIKSYSQFELKIEDIRLGRRGG
ncbi:MAG: single-stranded-DNA-specific exonuclease RecJ [Candidatus Omnitrophica bacterium]|nr:single-stranded-DNA-specific exonuclease RecJ [Candidatus Omnitrophota bacterium]